MPLLNQYEFDMTGKTTRRTTEEYMKEVQRIKENHERMEEERRKAKNK